MQYLQYLEDLADLLDGVDPYITVALWTWRGWRLARHAHQLAKIYAISDVIDDATRRIEGDRVKGLPPPHVDT